jgi:hypothetical protein
MVTKSVAFPSLYFRGDDVVKPLAVEIQHVNIEPLKSKDGTSEDKLIVYFVGQRKRLVCNRTNWDAIVETTNEDDTDLWVGHRICLFASLERVAGKMMNCVRVRSASAPPQKKAAPAPKAPTPKANGIDEISFGEPPDISDEALTQMLREVDERGDDI